MLPETVARLSSVNNIIGIKEATGDVSRVQTMRRNCREGFMLYSGDDKTSREFMLEGGDGIISVTANVAPEAMHNMSSFALEGDSVNAESVDKTLYGLHTDLYLEANPIPVKWAVCRLGLIEAGIRLPLTWLAEQFNNKVETAMKQAGVI